MPQTSINVSTEIIETITNAWQLKEKKKDKKFKRCIKKYVMYLKIQYRKFVIFVLILNISINITNAKTSNKNNYIKKK